MIVLTEVFLLTKLRAFSSQKRAGGFASPIYFVVLQR